MTPDTQFAGTPSQLRRTWKIAAAGGDAVVPCGTCAKCCRSGLFVNLTDEEAQRLPTQQTKDGRTVLAHNGRDCAMYDVENSRCSIYDTRPYACRGYDCRMLWLSLCRSLGRGEEMNEQLDRWRTQVHNDLDIGIVAVATQFARKVLASGGDVGEAAPLAAGFVSGMSDDDLRRIGQGVRRTESKELARVLGVLNSPSPPPRELVREP